MSTVRAPAVAGAFYPGQTAALWQDVASLLAHIPPDAKTRHPTPKALIVPHAGYVYSGPIAARAYARLAGARKRIRRVVLLGPAHRVPLQGLALPDTQAFATPLGQVEIDQHALALLSGLPQVVVSAAAHAQEHALEVQLPFLQSVLAHFTLVPLVVGNATAAQVAEVLALLWGGPETLIVVSTDLSHYLPYRTAQACDQDTVQHMLNLDSSITHQQACGGTPVNGLLLAAREHHLHAELLGICNSGDTAGDKARVVGYAALALNPQGRDAPPH
jgi:MEMO1 family protein